MIYTVTLNTAIDRIVKIDGVLARHQNNRIRENVYDIGGKATHVSVVLSALGIPNLATGFVGESNQELVYQLLEAKKVANSFVVLPGEKTRESMVLLDDSGEGSIMLTEKGFSISLHAYAELGKKLGDLVKQGDYVVIAGSAPPDFTPEMYGHLLKQVKKAGGRVVVDSSGAYLAEAATLAPYLIKPNEYEFQELVGRSLPTVDDYLSEMERLRVQGISYVVVSLGKKGSLISAPSGMYKIMAPVVEAKNDTGCGDVFLGGFIGKLSQACSLEETARFATALSASKAMKVESSTFSLEQTKELGRYVQIESLGGK